MTNDDLFNAACALIRSQGATITTLVEENRKLRAETEVLRGMVAFAAKQLEESEALPDWEREEARRSP